MFALAGGVLTSSWGVAQTDHWQAAVRTNAARSASSLGSPAVRWSTYALAMSEPNALRASSNAKRMARSSACSTMSEYWMPVPPN